MKYDDAVAECRERYGVREISDDAAIALCQAWMSGGTVGRYLAAVGTGSWTPESLRQPLTVAADEEHTTRGHYVLDDLHATFHNIATGDDDNMVVWSMLATWVTNGGDPVV